MAALTGISASTEGSETSLKQKELKKACEEFESIITGYLLKSMRETVSKADNGEDGQARDLYESMLDEALAKELSHRPGLGLAKTLYKQLAPLLEGKKPDLKSVGASADKLSVGILDQKQKK